MPFMLVIIHPQNAPNQVAAYLDILMVDLLTDINVYG